MSWLDAFCEGSMALNSAAGIYYSLKGLLGGCELALKGLDDVAASYAAKQEAWYKEHAGYTTTNLGISEGGKNSVLTSKSSTINSAVIGKGGSYSVYDNQSPKTGTDWNNYFINKYGQENVHWNLNSVDDIWSDPTRMVGYSENEMASVLGDGWTRGAYGSKGDGWKFMKDDVSVFYHPSGGKHGGAYYGISSGATGKIKVVDSNTYIPLSGDKATIIYH